MSLEQPKNRLSQIAENKNRVVKLAENGATISKNYSASEAALMFGIPGRVLEKSAVSIIPRRRGVEVTIGPDSNRHLDNITDWLKENRSESQRLMKERYTFLFLAIQSSVSPSVDFKNYIDSMGLRMDVLEKVFPEIEELSGHLEQGGRVQDLIREDKDYWGGFVHACYQALSSNQQEELKNQGMSPEYLFQTSD